jgi:hypothetical protein
MEDYFYLLNTAYYLNISSSLYGKEAIVPALDKIISRQEGEIANVFSNDREFLLSLERHYRGGLPGALYYISDYSELLEEPDLLPEDAEFIAGYEM